jgi:hypothetical protein
LRALSLLAFSPLVYCFFIPRLYAMVRDRGPGDERGMSFHGVGGAVATGEPLGAAGLAKAPQAFVDQEKLDPASRPYDQFVQAGIPWSEAARAKHAWQALEISRRSSRYRDGR